MILLLLAAALLLANGSHALRLLECAQNGQPVDTLALNAIVECRYELSVDAGTKLTALLSTADTDIALSYSGEVHALDATGSAKLRSKPAGDTLIVAFHYDQCANNGVPISLRTALDTGASVTTVLKQRCSARALEVELPDDNAPPDNTFAFLLIYTLAVVVVGCIACIYASPDGEYQMKIN
jgi:hypothetical protein